MDMSLLKVSEMLASPSHKSHWVSHLDELFLRGLTYCSQYKPAFDADFITCKPSLALVVQRLREWRDKLEPIIRKVPRNLHLENFSRYLVEFEHQKYDDVEVPGQYLLVNNPLI